MTAYDQLTVVGTVALAAGFGALIGIERELTGKPAGLRTHMFIAAAAALFVLLGEAALRQIAESPHGDRVRTDPVRMIHAIIVGVSFLGAGTIITNDRKHRIEGLTTAADVLLTTAIGVATAMSLYVLAAGATVFTITVLAGGRALERLYRRRSHHAEP